MSAVPSDNMKALDLLAPDWPKIIGDLRRAGLSVPDISAKTGIGRSALRDYETRYSQPRYHIGEIIIAVWTNATGQREVPRVSSGFNWPTMI